MSILNQRKQKVQNLVNIHETFTQKPIQQGKEGKKKAENKNLVNLVFTYFFPRVKPKSKMSRVFHLIRF